jgi:hypothetical protein
VRRSLSHPSHFFYRWSRLLRDLEVLSSGDPLKMCRRLRNKLIAKTLYKRTPFRKIWGRWF